MPTHPIMSPIRLFFCTALASSLLLISCASVEKHNKRRSEKITVEKLQHDIDYVERKLYKLHPSLDLYITKEQLSFKFDSIRNVVNKPMTSKEFYFVISPVIASVHQGHMSMIPMTKRYSRKELKRLKKAGEGPLSQFKYDWENGKLYVIKNNSKFSDIQLGTEIVAIKNIKPQDLYNKYRQSITSDGYNTTFPRKWFLRRFPVLLSDEIESNDSLRFEFKYKDSVFFKMINRKKPQKKERLASGKDTLSKSVRKANAKLERKKKKIFGYDTKTKEYSKSLQFLGNDKSVAYLKINDFTDGNFRKAYKILFDSIKKRESATLVIDLRDNPGGRMNEIMNLYSYLTNQDFILTQPAIVTSKTSMWQAGIFSNIPVITYPLAGVAYPFYMGFTYFKVKKKDDGTYYNTINSSKLQKPNPNNFGGKIYVLINGGSFSASCILSTALKANKDITFVGEETGGDFNGTVAGFMPVLTLPNSKIKWRLGLLDIRPVNQTNVIGHGIYPDKEIVKTINDIITNKDPELEWVLKELGK